MGGFKSLSQSLSFSSFFNCKQMEEAITLIKNISLCICIFLLRLLLVCVCVCVFELDKWQCRGGAFDGTLRDPISLEDSRLTQAHFPKNP